MKVIRKKTLLMVTKQLSLSTAGPPNGIQYILRIWRAWVLELFKTMTSSLKGQKGNATHGITAFI